MKTQKKKGVRIISKKTVKSQKSNPKLVTEFRKDIVSGDWILVSSMRQFKPQLISKKQACKPVSISIPIKDCPFENPEQAETIALHLLLARFNLTSKKEFRQKLNQILKQLNEEAVLERSSPIEIDVIPM